jgi:hypothetical protein
MMSKKEMMKENEKMFSSAYGVSEVAQEVFSDVAEKIVCEFSKGEIFVSVKTNLTRKKFNKKKKSFYYLLRERKLTYLASVCGVVRG